VGYTHAQLLCQQTALAGIIHCAGPAVRLHSAMLRPAEFARVAAERLGATPRARRLHEAPRGAPRAAQPGTDADDAM